VAYMIKLNIELSMGALITKLARSPVNPTQDYGVSHVASHYSHRRTSIALGPRRDGGHDDLKGIHAQTDIHILTEEDDNCQKKVRPSLQPSDVSSSEDKLPLRDNYPHTTA
jgi:hypothetical protein